MSPPSELAFLDARIRDASAGVRSEARASIEKLGEVVDPRTWVRAYPKTSMVVTCVGAAWITARATARREQKAPAASGLEEPRAPASPASNEACPKTDPSKAGVVLGVVASAITRFLLGHVVSQVANSATMSTNDRDPIVPDDPATN